MPKITANDRAYETFQAAVAADLIGKEGYVVELIPGGKTIQLYTATGNIQPLGVIDGHLEGDNASVRVRLIGRAATTRMVAGGVIRTGYGVKPQAGGKVIEGATGDKCIGIHASAGSSAANDIIEVADAYFTAY